jgi:hypothetical protein
MRKTFPDCCAPTGELSAKSAKRDANECLLHNLSQFTRAFRYHRIPHGLKNKGPTG